MRKPKRRRQWLPSLCYGFLRGRELEGTISKGPKFGMYILTAMRVGAGWGQVSAKRWSYPRPLVWPPPEPPGLDRIARFQRTFAHFYIRDLYDARVAISRRTPVQVSVPIFPDWYKAPGGLIRMPQPREFSDQHSIVLEGYDDGKQFFRFWNNWGPRWGDNGYGYLPYEYFNRYFHEAWFAVLEDPDPGNREWRRKSKTTHTHWLSESVFINALGHACLVIDLWDLANDVRIGWSIATVRNDWLEVEDFFIRPDYQGDKRHCRILFTATLMSSKQENLPARFYIPWVDTNYGSSNFALINDGIRAAKLVVSPTGERWAPYKAVLPTQTSDAP